MFMNIHECDGGATAGDGGATAGDGGATAGAGGQKKAPLPPAAGGENILYLIPFVTSRCNKCNDLL